MVRTYAWLAALGLVAGCGGLIKDEKSKGNGQCEAKKVLTPTDGCTVAQTQDDCAEDQQNLPQGGASEDGDPTAEAGANTAKDSKLPFNEESAALHLLGLLLDDGAGAAAPVDDADRAEPNPNPNPNPVDPKKPFPVAECRQTAAVLGNDGTDTFVGIDPVNPDDGGCMSTNTPENGLRLQDNADAAEPDGGASAQFEAQPNPPQGGRCAADATATKNVKATGTDTASKLEWATVDGLMVYQEGMEACTAKGDGWHMAKPDELNTLFQVAGFQIQGEINNCLTSFWAAGATDSGNQCTAGTRGFRWVSTDPSNPLPINADVVSRIESGQASVLETNSVLCVKGNLKPTVQCGPAVQQLLASKPLGVVDLKTGMTWAKITVKEFPDAAGVEEQCAKGASQGWRIPTKAELKAAVENDTFQTAAYEGTDNTCPKSWHKPEADQTTTRTCGALAVDASGAATFAEDDACKSEVIQQMTPLTLIPAIDPNYGSTAPIGLCVQDKQ